MKFNKLDLSRDSNTAGSIVAVRNVMLTVSDNKREFRQYIPFMVSEGENARNLSEYLAKKAKYNSFKTSVN